MTEIKCLFRILSHCFISTN